MQISERRALLKAQVPIWRLVEDDEEKTSSFERAQCELFNALLHSSDCKKQRQVSDGFLSVTPKEHELNSAQAENWFDLTERMLIKASATELEGIIKFSKRAGSIQLFVRYYDYSEHEIGIDFPPLYEDGFLSPIPMYAHHAELGLCLEVDSYATVDEVCIKGIIADASPISPENPTAEENVITRSFAESMSDLVAHIPDSNGSAYFRGAKRPHVGIITDDFMFNYYADALDLEYLTPEDYENQIEDGSFDFVLYVSCWLGMRPPDEDELFEYRPSEAIRIVPSVFEKARECGIPALFQSIEDPPSYSLFLPIAKAADVVFTSAVEMIPKYVRDTKNPLVFYQPYGINPILHNPIGCMKKHHLGFPFHKNSVFFAGSWYGAYKERCKDTVLLFDSVVRDAGKNLIVADRTLHFPSNKRRAFPPEYNEFIVEPIDHQLLQKVHKLFDFAINLNTIKDSETMGAMRVYEVQALGSLLISNQSKSLENAFPEVLTVTESTNLRSYFDCLSQSDIVRQQLAGIRKILSNATVQDRLNTMFLHSGIPIRFRNAVVHVFADVRDNSLLGSFSEQTYEFKELHPIEEFEGMEIDEGFIAIMTSRYPSVHFLEDAMNAFKYVDVEYVSVLPFDCYPEAFDYVQQVPDPANTVFKSKDAAVFALNAMDLEHMSGFAIVSDS